MNGIMERERMEGKLDCVLTLLKKGHSISEACDMLDVEQTAFHEYVTKNQIDLTEYQK